MVTQDEQMMDAVEVSKLLRMSRESVYRLARQRVIPSVKIGGAVRFNRSAILAVAGNSGSFLVTPTSAPHKRN